MTSNTLGEDIEEAGTNQRPGNNDDPSVKEPRQRHDRFIVVGSVFAAVIPTVVSVWWAIVNREWMAGDRSIMGIFTHDVLSTNPPLLATVSTMGNYSGAESAAGVHHLGPAQFWALTPFDWAFAGRPVGLVVGALVINVVSIGLVIAFTWRRLDARAAAAMALVCTILSYGLGPSLLRDIWTPFLGLWPLLALMVLVWSLLDGDVWSLPWAVAMATFLAQIELLYVAPAAILSIVGGLGFLLRRRTMRRRAAAAGHEADGSSGPALAPARRATVVSVIIALWLWSPVIWQELNGRPGNLTLLWQALGHQTDRAGWTFVWHHLIAQLQVPPVWMQRATSAFDIGHDIGVLAVGSAVVFSLLYAAVTVATHRTRLERPTRYYLMITGYAVLLAGFVNLWITPAEGIIGLQYRRWIWPSGAYLWFALGLALASELADRTDIGRYRDEPARTVAIPMLVLALMVCVPASRDQLTPPSQDVVDNQVIESMWDPLLGRLPPQTTYVSLDGAQAAFGVGPEIIRRMVVHGYVVRVPSFGVDSYGAHREFRRDNGPVHQTLRVVTGPSLAPSERPNAILAAGRNDGASAEGFVTLIAPVLERARTSTPFAADRVTLEQLGQEALPGRPDPTEAARDLLGDPSRAIFDVTVLQMVADGLITGGPLSQQDAVQIVAETDELQALAFLNPPPSLPVD